MASNKNIGADLDLSRATSTTAVFDVSVSIVADPAGDNDSKVDAGASDDEQNAYETIFQHFADSVCEQSNGVHKLGKISVFKKGAQAKNANIVWGTSGRPSARVSGFGGTGNIKMYDTFGSIKVSDGGDDLTRLGYITGHEWGHYVLGVWDEYREAGKLTGEDFEPIDSDKPTDKAIMNSGRTAVSSGDFSWLNHSTSNNIDLANTAQGRVFGKSGWDTLISTTNNDPTTIGKYAAPKRTHYSNLVGQQPTAADSWFKIQLPAGQADCRDKLDIAWVDNLELDIVLDRSGSMGGSRIANAKSAATALIDTLPEGTTAAGVSSFSSSVTSNAAMTAIASAAEKTTLKNAVSSIGTGGSTAMFDGAVFGLNKLLNYASANSTNAQQLVFLLTDGGDNASTETLATATNKFVAAGIPVIGFGYGSASDPNLPALAANTNGRYFFSPTTVTDIQNAFAQAFADVSGSAPLGSASVSAAAGATDVQTFVIDDTLDAISILFTYSGAVADFTLALLDNNDADTGQTFTCNEASGAVSCVLNLDAAAVTALGTGTFKVSAVNNSTSDIVTSLNIVAETKDSTSGGGYNLDVASLDGPNVSYPAPITISAVLARELPITGVSVTATVTDPSGNVSTIDLNDDGVGADQYANDGFYSAWASYGANGVYEVRITMDNDAGNAAYTGTGVTNAHYAAMAGLDPNETVADPVLPAGNFQRFASSQITVSGVQPDDHANDPTGGACTALTADNVSIDGRIDVAGDADCFAIAGPVPNTSDLTVRTFNNAVGAEPKFTVFAADGTTQIASADPATAAPSNGALFTTIAAADIDTNGLVILVEDSDAAHVGGGFSVSAGAALVSDKPVSGGTTTTGGGAIGPIGLGGLGLLALAGLIGRRRRHS
ncbi:MAG: VWA domain-containing protein [Pseudomonadota bacterium]